MNHQRQEDGYKLTVADIVEGFVSFNGGGAGGGTRSKPHMHG